MKNKVKATKSENTIVLVKDKKVLNIQKSQRPKEFEEISRLMDLNDIETLSRRFNEISEGVEKFSKGNFTVNREEGVVYFRGDRTTPMPKSLVNKLREHYSKGVSCEPLVRFWKKVLLNPNPNSREELFDFMLKNNIPLTDTGDIIVEKGVKRLSSGTLVDCHTQTVDNSIGMTVRMPVEMVDSDRRNECSNGLHVGAPDYVRNHWSSDIILTCTVSPEHVVSVPKDYSCTKMRVCEYRVVGLAEKSRIDPSKLVFRLEDIFDEEEAIKSAERRKGKPALRDKITSDVRKKSVKSVVYSPKNLEPLSIVAIKKMVEAEFGVKITKKIKSDVIKEACRISKEKRVKVYTQEDFNELTKSEIIAKVMKDFSIVIEMKKKTRSTLINEAIQISKNR